MDTVGDQPVEAIEARQDNGVRLADFLLSEIHDHVWGMAKLQ